MRKERKSRAKKSSVSNAGRPKVSDPRETSHLMLFASERKACDARAKRLGLGFSPWARSLLLASVAEELVAGKVPSGSVAGTLSVLMKAIVCELRDLPPRIREQVTESMILAFRDLDESRLSSFVWPEGGG